MSAVGYGRSSRMLVHNAEVAQFDVGTNTGHSDPMVHNTKVDASCRVNLTPIQAFLTAFAAQFKDES